MRIVSEVSVNRRVKLRMFMCDLEEAGGGQRILLSPPSLACVGEVGVRVSKTLTM